VSYERSAPEGPTITNALLLFLTEELRQMGAIERFLYGFEKLGDDVFFGDPLKVYEEANDSAFLRAVDNFQTYISELILCILTVYPQPFFGRKIDAELLFTNNSIEDLQKLVIDREVNDLTYKSVVDLEKFVSEKFGFYLFGSALQRARVKYLYDVRNLIIHNRGVVNHRFLSANPKSKQVLKMRLHAPECLRTTLYLKSVAIGIDQRAMGKFTFPSEMTVTKSELANV
jgi:hypothetical protein